MKVGVLRRVNLECVLVEALATQTVALEVGELDATVTSSLDDINTEVGDTAIGALLGSARRAGIGVNTKVLVNSALAPDVAACVERTRVHVSNVGTISGRLRSWLLRAALGVFNTVGKGGFSLAETQNDLGEERFATRESPRLWVETLELLSGETVLGGEGVPVVVILNGIRKALAVDWLGPPVGEGTAGAAIPHPGFDIATLEIWVVLCEVAGRYSTHDSQIQAAGARLGLD